MEAQQAIEQIEAACLQISLQMMKVQPAAAHLGDEQTQSDVIKAAHQLTVELEVIKKKLIQLKGRDDSTDL